MESVAGAATPGGLDMKTTAAVLGCAIGCIALALAVAACGCEEELETVEVVEVVGDAPDPMATPRGSIEHQLALLVAGDADALRACFTKRQQERITEEAVAKGAKEVGGMPMEELFASVEEGEYQGQQTAKVMMKNGRSLTTLVLTDGKWLADTVWFR